MKELVSALTYGDRGDNWVPGASSSTPSPGRARFRHQAGQPHPQQYKVLTACCGMAASTNRSPGSSTFPRRPSRPISPRFSANSGQELGTQAVIPPADGYQGQLSPLPPSEPISLPQTRRQEPHPGGHRPPRWQGRLSCHHPAAPSHRASPSQLRPPRTAFCPRGTCGLLHHLWLDN